MRSTLLFIAALLYCSWAAAEVDFEESSTFDAKPLDGVLIEAVETYKNPKSNETLVGIAVYPLNPYFTGFGVHLGFTHYYSRKWAWEVFNGAYIFGVQKDLTSELAEKYQVNPKRIEKLDLAIASNIEYVHSYGKFVLSEKYINYFRSSFFGGLGFLHSNEDGRIALSLGARFEVQTSETYSWKLDIRDLITLTRKTENVVYVGLGTGVGF